MQVQKDTLFYSNVRPDLDVESDDVRQLLVQEQKACRARARQYSLETNRRRKALEDKRRHQDVQEQRMRENILQQRKQKLQEDTERFQRAHLPPSQRRRQVFITRVPNMDEVLSHIQGTQTSYTHQSSFLSDTSIISRSSTSSSKPPEGSSGPRSLRSVSAAQAHAKLMQERSLGNFKTNQQIFINQLQENLLKDQEQLRKQEHSDAQISHAESLSSLDSLENEAPQHGHGNKPDSLYTPEVHDTRRPTSLQRQLNCPSPLSNPCPPKRFLEKVMSQQGLPSSSSSSLLSPVEDEPADEDQNVQKFLKAALTNHTDLKSRNVQFQKGILKTKLKYTGDGAAKFNYTPGQFTFSKQVAIAIRDSLELSLSKIRDPEINKCIKKLRWSDGMNGDGGENKEIVTKELSKPAETQCRLTQPPQQPLVDQQQGSFHPWYMKIPSGLPKNKMTTSGTADPSSTQQACSDVASQKGKQQGPTGDFRVEKVASCTSGLLVSQQAHSARTDSGTFSSQARRGTMVIPQSSNQEQHMVRTQGKVLVPRPPLKSEVTGGISGQAMMYITKTGNSDECSQVKACLAEEQVLNKEYREGQPTPRRHILRTDQGTLLAPGSNSYACMYETVSKSIYTLCQSAGQVGSGSIGFQKAILDRTPTDDEISLLWNGVRSALSHKDDDSQSLQTHNGPLSALPETRANLSHVTMNGDSMFSGVKASAGMGGLFLSSSNVKSPMRRPTLENNMVKNRTAALGYRKPPVQTTVPKTASKTDQMVRVQDGNEHVAVNTAQFQRAAEFLQSQRGLSALSLEEQKLLQSLDNLNHRLQYLQDAGKPALKGILVLDPAFNQSPQPGEHSCATLRKYHGSSADSRTRSHRRY